MNIKLLAIVTLGFIVSTTCTQASLIDRGNGLLYDNVLDVTWLQDANYAHTSGYEGADSNGRMNWWAATSWAAGLDYGGYNDWRLASNSPVNGSSFKYIKAKDGSTDVGYNITSPHSELSYMYHVNLGLKDYYDTTGAYQADFGIFGNGTSNGVDNASIGQKNIGLVNNMQSLFYWSGSEYAPISPGTAWSFGTFGIFSGNQDWFGKSYYFFAWAVRPGDVAAVPIPSSFWLLGSGLVGLIGLKRRGNFKSKDFI